MLELTDKLKVIIHVPSNQSPSDRSNEERAIRWSEQENMALTETRGELERDFIVKKRNKALWGVVASRMTGRGYFRTVNQCKCKWEILFIKYKGIVTSNPENISEFPCFNEMYAAFKEQACTMQGLLVEAETCSPTKKRHYGNIFSDKVEEITYNLAK